LTSSSPKSSGSGERIDTGNSLSCFLSMYSTRNTSTLFRTKNDNLQKVLSVVILLATALHTENRRNGEPSQTWTFLDQEPRFRRLRQFQLPRGATSKISRVQICRSYYTASKHGGATDSSRLLETDGVFKNWRRTRRAPSIGYEFYRMSGISIRWICMIAKQISYFDEYDSKLPTFPMSM
jgi:hypothetical protein